MFALVVRFDVRADGVEAADALIAEAVPLIRDREPGTLVYATHRVESEPLARVFYEVYADRAAFETHEAQPHVVAFLGELAQHLERRPRVELLTPGPRTGVPGPTLG